MTRQIGKKSIDIFEEDWKDLQGWQKLELESNGTRYSLADLVHIMFETFALTKDTPVIVGFNSLEEMEKAIKNKYLIKK
jgi:hypothetical protein